MTPQPPLSSGTLVCNMAGATVMGSPGTDSAPPMVGIGVLIAIGVAARMARSGLTSNLPAAVEVTRIADAATCPAGPPLRIAARSTLQLDLVRTIAIGVVAMTVVGLVIAAQWYMLHDL